MFKNIVLASIVAAVLIVGASQPVQALTASEVQAQIQSLVQKIAELTRQLNSMRGTVDPSTGVSTSPMPMKHRICALLNRNLMQGAQGDDVRGLQEFLYEQKMFTVTPTGYFGPMTAQAVAKWQANEGVSAVGSFGPLSRERMRIWCGGGWNNQERFSASPTRGDAPLTVVFDTWLGGFRGDRHTTTYTIDFGDGTSERAVDCPAPADACTGPGQNKHTYVQNGVFTAILYKDDAGGCGPNADPRCLGAPASRMAVAKAQVSVGPVACTKEYKPVCGAKTIYCITTPCNPIPTTYGNRCEMNADGASFLYEGQCRSDYPNPADNPQCKSWYDGCNTCSRSAPGQPAMCTMRACMEGGMTKPYCTAYFDTTNRPPTVSSFSGPTTLNVNAHGTWTINASDPEGGQLTYQISWGDENVYASSMSSAPSAREFVQTTTFSHAYANAGTYTVAIIVQDSAGQQANTSTTVRVGSTEPIACTADAYQCPNGSWVGRSGPNCQFVCPTPSTSDASSMPSNCQIWQTHSCSGYSRNYSGGPVSPFTGACAMNSPLATPQCNMYF